jgi:hypothetical protein
MKLAKHQIQSGAQHLKTLGSFRNLSAFKGDHRQGHEAPWSRPVKQEMQEGITT